MVSSWPPPSARTRETYDLLAQRLVDLAPDFNQWRNSGQYIARLLVNGGEAARYRAVLETMGNRVAPPDERSGSTPCLEFYRRELLSTCDEVRSASGQGVFCVVMGMAFASLGTRLPSSPVPSAIAGLVVVAFGVFQYMRVKRELPRIQEELTDLDAFNESTAG